MMKRKTIGKIQLILGILLIIGAVIAFIMVNNRISEINEQFGIFKLPSESDPSYSAMSNESKLIIVNMYVDVTTKKEIFNTQIYTLIIFSAIIIPALLFILISEGLLNIQGGKK